ncbi:MAG: hypothetical protein ACREQJ_09000 [Candidatus Binatia bacterium]
MRKTATWMVALALVSASSASAIGPRIVRYSVEGFIDRAPEGATVIGSLRIERGEASRTILLTANQSTADTLVCSSCDSPLEVAYAFALIGDEAVIDRLLRGSEGTKVSGTFTRTRTDRHLIMNDIEG